MLESTTMATTGVGDRLWEGNTLVMIEDSPSGPEHKLSLSLRWSFT